MRCFKLQYIAIFAQVFGGSQFRSNGHIDITCTSHLTIHSGGKINLNGAGYAPSLQEANDPISGPGQGHGQSPQCCPQYTDNDQIL